MKNSQVRLIALVLIVVFGVSAGKGLVLAQPAAEQPVVEQSVEPQEGVEIVTEESAADLTAAESIDYYLPYPGILPDHPLYWLKMIRDRVQLWLVTKPLARAEKLLLYADKRLGAGWALIEGNKVSLGVTTLTKAEKYLEQAWDVVDKLGDGAREQEFRQRFSKAARKHNEVLGIVAEKVSEEHRLVIRQMEEKLKREQVRTNQVETMIDFSGDETAEAKVEANSAFEALIKTAEQNGLVVKSKEYDFGMFVEEIDGRQNSDNQAWIYYVNGKAGEVAADKQGLGEGDKVEWRYEKPVAGW